ncbi:MAG: hypothetical protein OQJ89_00065, partial [Kangiellaceae bacterium]|nr:hypothetical protein [Kangiellaceae bacterium]
MTFSFQKPINLTLSRYPKSGDRSLRAWNAADEYLIEQLSQSKQINSPLLIVNDQFGALTCSLNSLSPVIWTDSQLSKIAIKQNLKDNHGSSTKPKFLEGDLANPQNLNLEMIKKMARFNTVLVRIPKHLSLLQFQLHVIKQLVDERSTIIAGGMTKEIHNSTIALFES